jgi:hypothetical protein
MGHQRQAFRPALSRLKVDVFSTKDEPCFAKQRGALHV